MAKIKEEEQEFLMESMIKRTQRKRHRAGTKARGGPIRGLLETPSKKAWGQAGEGGGVGGGGVGVRVGGGERE